MKRWATFAVHSSNALGGAPTTAIGCDIEWDAQRGCWRAYDKRGNEGLSQYQPLAAARCFAAAMEREGGHLDASTPASPNFSAGAADTTEEGNVR